MMIRPLTTQEQARLDGWLDVATADLIPQARARIRLEIEAHYIEAIDDHLAKGLSESDACSATLAELGEPETAAKDFRKRHLTEREAKSLQLLLKHSRSFRRLLICYACLVPLVLLFLVLGASSRDFRFWAVFALVAIGSPTASFFAARTTKLKSSISGLVLIDVIRDLVFCGLVWWGLPQSWNPWCGILPSMLPDFLRLRSWNKIRKSGEPWNETLQEAR